MKDRDFLNTLALKLMSSAARIKDLEKEVALLKLELAKKQELVKS